MNLLPVIDTFARLVGAACLVILVVLADAALRLAKRRAATPPELLHGGAEARHMLRADLTRAARRVAETRVHPTQRLTDPPMIDGVTLRDFLIHHHRQTPQPPKDDGTLPLGVWADVVTSFYAHAAADPEIADYFRNTDLNRQQAHFLRALDIVTSKGLTQGTVDYMRKKHAGIRASNGLPITGAVYDRVIGVLAEVLHAHGVPERGTAALAATIAPLRPVIVRA